MRDGRKFSEGEMNNEKKEKRGKGEVEGEIGRVVLREEDGRGRIQGCNRKEGGINGKGIGEKERGGKTGRDT